MSNRSTPLTVRHPNITCRLINSGTTLALVSDSVVSAIYDAIPGSRMDTSIGGWVYPAGAAVPDIEFAVGDTMFKINAADFPYGTATGGLLFGGIQSRGNNEFDILGDSEFIFIFGEFVQGVQGANGRSIVFLKSVYVVFDQGNVRIGMAQRST